MGDTLHVPPNLESPEAASGRLQSTPARPGEPGSTQTPEILGHGLALPRLLLLTHLENKPRDTHEMRGAAPAHGVPQPAICQGNGGGPGDPTGDPIARAGPLCEFGGAALFGCYSSTVSPFPPCTPRGKRVNGSVLKASRHAPRGRGQPPASNPSRAAPGGLFLVCPPHRGAICSTGRRPRCCTLCGQAKAFRGFQYRPPGRTHSLAGPPSPPLVTRGE